MSWYPIPSINTFVSTGNWLDDLYNHQVRRLAEVVANNGSLPDRKAYDEQVKKIIEASLKDLGAV